MLVSCACGCKRLVKPAPAYFDKDCRHRAAVRRWRQEHPERARAIDREAAKRYRAKRRRSLSK